MNRRRLPALVLPVVLLALGLAACGEKEETTGAGSSERVNLVLDYLPNADHAGIYAAIEEGEFKTAKLDVKPRTPSDPSAPLKLLASGRADLAISYEPELLLARAKGADLVAVGALVQKPLTSIISLDSKPIRSAASLEDRKVGTAGVPYQDAYLKTILEQAGADPDRAVEGLLDANRDLDEELQRAALRATLPLLLPPGRRPYGWQEPKEWNAFAAWMQENDLTQNVADARDAFTNEFLPGEGL